MDPGSTTRGLRMMPVVVAPDEGLAAVVEAGAARSGDSPTFVVVPFADAPTLIAAAHTGAEMVIAACRGAEAVGSFEAARKLGCRGIPVIELAIASNRPAIRETTLSLLLEVSDLNVPVPAIVDEAMRRALWEELRAARLEDRHHLVEVDGKPARDELEARCIEISGDELQLLAAGAAGVLAGRMVEANRRWRAESP